VLSPPAHRGWCLVQAPRWGVSRAGGAVWGPQIGPISPTDSEGPEAATLATVRPLGPVRSWVGLGVVRGVQLGPWPLGARWVRWPVTSTGDRHRGWLLHPSPVRTGAWRPGAEAARVLGSQAWAAAPSQVHAPARAVTARPLAERLQTGLPSSSQTWRLPAGTPEFLNQLEGGRDFVDEPPTNSTFCLHTPIAHAVGYRPHSALTCLPGIFMHPHRTDDRGSAKHLWATTAV
jgi:hypothetical protein